MQPLPLNFPQDCLPERRLLSQLLPFAGAGGSGAQSVSYRTYADSLNPPILHRKELMLPADHPRRTEYEALTCAAQAVGLFDEPRRIGYRRQWLALVREQGYRIEGHALVPLGNDETNLTSVDDPTPVHAAWQASRQLTALVRYGFSAPVQSLARYGLLDGRYRFFDYGCGRGDDVRGLTENGLTAAGWDPYHAPDNPIRAADIVNLGFVIEQLFQIAETLNRWTIAGFDLVRSRTPPDLDDACGRFLTFRQLIACGETQAQTGLANLPIQPESYNAVLELAEQVLDPVIDYFGMIRLTYGFCSPQLAKQIPGRIDPKLDQHAAHERNRLGQPICGRLGAAVDFLVEDENMLEVAQWVAANTPFDRLYVYGEDLPIHVSYGPNHDRQIVRMTPGRSGRLVPRVVLREDLLG
ncbi:hypothetical protein [uncultured Thiodictyon sp.]|jgi:hypothetical protein|uniref:hypothetical protein n=1 Tax=uncultured Thiodictyon sp. TaxID=1846217 RepID=UPI0025E368C3|nr:hypothetical protein [uncultured Thiodictyon sp.]